MKWLKAESNHTDIDCQSGLYPLGVEIQRQGRDQRKGVF